MKKLIFLLAISSNIIINCAEKKGIEDHKQFKDEVYSYPMTFISDRIRSDSEKLRIDADNLKISSKSLINETLTNLSEIGHEEPSEKEIEEITKQIYDFAIDYCEELNNEDSQIVTEYLYYYILFFVTFDLIEKISYSAKNDLFKKITDLNMKLAINWKAIQDNLSKIKDQSMSEMLQIQLMQPKIVNDLHLIIDQRLFEKFKKEMLSILYSIVYKNISALEFKKFIYTLHAGQDLPSPENVISILYNNKKYPFEQFDNIKELTEKIAKPAKSKKETNKKKLSRSKTFYGDNQIEVMRQR